MNTKHCIDVCNRLLRGERSALETYGKVIAHYGSEAASVELTRIHGEHQKAVRLLEESVRSMGGVPDVDAGLWGSFTGSVQSAANLLGSGTAIEALKAGERAGKSDYEAALGDPDVMLHAKELIRENLLPATERHIAALDAVQLEV